MYKLPVGFDSGPNSGGHDTSGGWLADPSSNGIMLPIASQYPSMYTNPSLAYSAVSLVYSFKCKQPKNIHYLMTILLFQIKMEFYFKIDFNRMSC